MPLAQLSPTFSYFPRYPQASCALLVLVPGWVACVHSKTLWAQPMDSPVRLGVSPQQVFSVRGFEAFLPGAGTMGCMVCFTPQLFLPVCLHENVGPFGLPATTSPTQSSSHPLVLHPLCPALPVWMNVSSLTPWLSDFHRV